MYSLDVDSRLGISFTLYIYPKFCGFVGHFYFCIIGIFSFDKFVCYIFPEILWTKTSFLAIRAVDG